MSKSMAEAAQEFEARQWAARGAVLDFAQGWQRTLLSMAENQIKWGSGCLCTPAHPEMDELAHSNPNCPVFLFLSLGRLILEDARKRCGQDQ